MRRDAGNAFSLQSLVSLSIVTWSTRHEIRSIALFTNMLRITVKSSRWLFAVLLSVAASAAFSADCGPGTTCKIDGGEYYLRVPAGEGPHPVMVWFHGHGGSGASIHKNGALVKSFFNQGYALLAPNGFRRSGGTRSFSAFDGAPRNDVAFTFAVLEDAAERANLDLDRVMVSGFSAGGSMAWLLACEAGERLSGMVSIAGALRRPNSTDCAGLAGLPIMQVHGFKDVTVPLEGRGIRNWHQGSVWDSLESARKANGCRSNPDSIVIEELYRKRVWDNSCARATVRLDIHDGRHGIPSGWGPRARAFLESAN